MQMNQIKAADRGKENGDPHGSPGPGMLNVVSNSAVTPMKRVPILANFEEWMKMATDNKINATNSWNFALIDYFHDMSLLKEGDTVNFQKASCTLDGCVKIYTSRVDSVASETGKLLSGLADSGGGKKARERQEGEEGESADEEEGEGEDGTRKKAKKKVGASTRRCFAGGIALTSNRHNDHMNRRWLRHLRPYSSRSWSSNLRLIRCSKRLLQILMKEVQRGCC
jgi:Condensin complex subunit 2